MNMAMKLLIMMCEEDGKAKHIDVIRQALPVEMLKGYFDPLVCKDKKLSDIGMHLISLIHKSLGDDAKSASEQSQQLKTQEQI